MHHQLVHGPCWTSGSVLQRSQLAILETAGKWDFALQPRLVLQGFPRQVRAVDRLEMSGRCPRSLHDPNQSQSQSPAIRYNDIDCQWSLDHGITSLVRFVWAHDIALQISQFRHVRSGVARMLTSKMNLNDILSYAIPPTDTLKIAQSQCWKVVRSLVDSASCFQPSGKRKIDDHHPPRFYFGVLQ